MASHRHGLVVPWGDLGCVLRFIMVLTLVLDLFVTVDTPVNKILLRKHSFEDSLTVLNINSMQVLSLDLLFSIDNCSIKST